MSVITSTYPQISPSDRDYSVGCGRRWGFVAADLGVCGKQNGLCHPGVAIALLWLPGVSRSDTPGYSNGIPSGCTVVGMRKSPKSGGDFVLEDIGGELLMSQDCPEFARGGDGRGSGVKAVPQARDRSPRPGGIRGGLEHDEHPWGLRRGVSTANGGLVGMRRMPEWGWGFIWQDAGGEWVRRHKCPEFQWGKAWKFGEPGSPGDPADAGRPTGIPIVADPMPSPCLLPNLRVIREAEAGIAMGMVNEVRGISFVPDGTSAGAVRATHRWKRWAIIGRPYGTSTAGKAPPRTYAVPPAGRGEQRSKKSQNIQNEVRKIGLSANVGDAGAGEVSPGLAR